MLLALGSAFRVQSLRLIKLNNIVQKNTGVEMKVDELIKTNKARSQATLCIPALL